MASENERVRLESNKAAQRTEGSVSTESNFEKLLYVTN